MVRCMLSDLMSGLLAISNWCMGRCYLKLFQPWTCTKDLILDQIIFIPISKMLCTREKKFNYLYFHSHKIIIFTEDIDLFKLNFVVKKLSKKRITTHQNLVNNFLQKKFRQLLSNIVLYKRNKQFIKLLVHCIVNIVKVTSKLSVLDFASVTSKSCVLDFARA